MRSFTQLVQLGRGTVEQVAVSPDGRWLAAVGSQGVRLYAADTLQFVRQFAGDGQPIIQLAWAPDSTRLAAAGDPAAVRIWLADTGTLAASLPISPELRLRRVAWSPDGARIAFSARHLDPSKSSSVVVLDAATGQPLISHTCGLCANLAWSPDGAWLALYEGPAVHLLSTAAPPAGQLLLLYPSSGPIHSLAWSPDSTQLVTGAGEPNPFGPPDYTVRVFDLANPVDPARAAQRFAFDVPLPAAAVAWSPDGRLLAAGLEDRTLRLWDAASGQLLQTLRGHTDGVTALAWLADSQLLISAGRDGTLRQWQALQGLAGRTAADDRVNPPITNQVAWSPDGGRLALAGQDGTVQVWDALAWSPVAVLHGHFGFVNSVAWAPDGLLLASGGQDGFVHLWDTAEWQPVLRLPAEGDAGGWVHALAWRPGDGAYLAVAAHPVRVWDTRTWQVAHQFTHEFCSARRVAWVNAGNWLVVALERCPISILELDAFRTLPSKNSRSFRGNDLTSSPDGHALIWDTHGGEPGIRLWNIVRDGEPTGFDAPIRLVTAIAWSPNGRWCAFGSADSEIQIWDVATQTLLVELQGHTGEINSLAWSPDSTRLVSASEDGTVRVWGMPAP